jgi:hypothetical protein
VLADKACGSRGNRACLRRRCIRCTIPEKAGQVRNRKNKGRAGGPGDLGAAAMLARISAR